jgi:hypothetical protein
MRCANAMFAVCAAVAVAAPATAAPAGEPVPCLSPHRIVSYRDLDDRALIVRAIGGKYYRLDLAGGCIGLDDMIAVGVRQRGVGVCVEKGDEITYNYHGFGPQRCLITGVSPYTPKPGSDDDEPAEDAD